MRIKSMLTGVMAVAMMSTTGGVFAKPVANLEKRAQWSSKVKTAEQWKKTMDLVIPENTKVKPDTKPKENHGHLLCCQAHIDTPWHATNQSMDSRGVKGAIEGLISQGTNPVIWRDIQQVVGTMVIAQSSVGLRCSTVDEKAFNGACPDPREYEIQCYQDDAIMSYTKMRVGVDCKTPTNNRPQGGYPPNYNLEIGEPIGDMNALQILSEAFPFWGGIISLILMKVSGIDDFDDEVVDWGNN